MADRSINIKITNDSYHLIKRDIEYKFHVIDIEPLRVHISITIKDFIGLFRKYEQLKFDSEYEILYKIIKICSPDDLRIYLEQYKCADSYDEEDEKNEIHKEFIVYVMRNCDNIDFFKVLLRYTCSLRLLDTIFESSRYDNLYIFLEEVICFHLEEIKKCFDCEMLEDYFCLCIKYNNYNLLRIFLLHVCPEYDRRFINTQTLGNIVILSSLQKKYEFADFICDQYPGKIFLDINKNFENYMKESITEEKIDFSVETLNFLHELYISDKIDFSENIINYLIKISMTNNNYDRFLYLITVFPNDALKVHDEALFEGRKYAKEIEKIIQIYKENKKELDKE